MDRNQSTGLILLTAMLIAYFAFFGDTGTTQQQLPAEGFPTSDSLAVNEPSKPEKEDPIILPDSVLQQQFGFFALGKKGLESDLVLENDLVSVTFNTKGAAISRVELKQFVDQNKEPLVLVDDKSLSMEEVWSTKYGDIDLNSLYYKGRISGNQAIFTLTNGDQELTRSYTLDPDSYVVRYQVSSSPSVDGLWRNQPVEINWTDRMRRVEKDMQTSRIRTTVNYYMEEEEFDQLSETSTSPESEVLERPAKWISMKQKFFNMGMITDRSFKNVKVDLETPDEAVKDIVKVGRAYFEVPKEDLMTDASGIRFYFGPNDLEICSTVTEGYAENVYLGWAIFVPINQYLIVPFFHFLEGFISNYGIIILVLVFVVKMALFPLTYKSYLSMAKNRVLKPEMDAIKEKYGDDMQKIQQETLKVQGQFGVSPLSGCIPLVAQMPILVALFTFFPNAIQLRQEAFLWADDLSTYDTFINLPFTIPAYGSHVSLFTLLMTSVTIINTYYNNQMNSASAAMQGPMKYMGYFMPLIFMVVLNSYSSGLTYYYFLSTSITIIQQLVSKAVINEDEIRKKLEENKKKNANKKGGTFMSRMEKIMREQQEKQREGGAARKPSAEGGTASKGAKNLKGRKKR